MTLSREQVLDRVAGPLRAPAGLVLEWLLPDDDSVDTLSAHDVLYFVWYRLPTKWMVDEAELAEITSVAAAVMEAAGRPRVAQLIRDPRTAQVQVAWRRDRRQAVRLYEQAMVDSGYAPPDTDVLAWGTVMGVDEVTARANVAMVLEKAVDSGVFTPGRSGWRRMQANLAEAWLTSPARAFDGRVPVDVVRAERREAWIRSRSPMVRGLLTAVLPQAETAEPVPEGMAAPLRWLCDRIGDGMTLTQAEYLPTAVVAEAKERWYADWVLPGFATRSESDLPPLLILREFAREAKLVTKRGRRLTVSRAGRQVLADPALWCRTVVSTWFGNDDIVTEVAEVATAMLLRGDRAPEDLKAVALEGLASRFRRRDGNPVDERDIANALYEWLRPGNSLGFVAYRRGPQRLTGLTEIGRAAALAGLRARTYAPRTFPG